ncbi:FKBP-type peptidyl-prolyl cis-trans isomerase [Microbacterium oryzae]|uniref:FKBP-type peptidyl-prolyl cis-trans isomerase n=1 Tax=Microbacterium oryzae TaxID=743009 RepID=UPI0025AF3914|nr:FKBP-type peptidyl-prolyl cis-trans isomerase [Microbacterium oryzae]MDN3311468.1 FKBP-type peptidyl-prolyl cis-trans isomerase [Microbacterium oryzae]
MSTAVLAALALAGCSPAGDADTEASPSAAPADLCDAAAPTGDAVESVTVEGEVGEPATASFEAPLEFDESQRIVLEEGDGDPVASGDYLQYAMTAYDAVTGDEIGQIGYEEAELLPSLVSPEALGQFVGCENIGSRLVLALPGTTAADGTVSNGQIYVFDMLGTTPTAAWGEEQEPTAGLPTVELAEDGAPTITIPEGAEAPETTELSTLKAGDGATVDEGDAVLVQYTGVKLSDGSVFDSSWESGTPAQFQTTGVVEGFKKALEGQKVGSQVLAVIPPVEGYGEGEINDTDLVGETLVFVVDILATQHVAAAATETPAE